MPYSPLQLLAITPYIIRASQVVHREHQIRIASVSIEEDLLINA